MYYYVVIRKGGNITGLGKGRGMIICTSATSASFASVVIILPQHRPVHGCYLASLPDIVVVLDVAAFLAQILL